MNDSFMLNFIKKRKVSKKGWRANDSFFVKDSNIIENIKRLELGIHNSSLIDKNIDRIKKLNEECKANKVKLILVLPPYSEYYYGLTNFKYNKIIHEIISEKLTNIQVIDALEFMSTGLEFYENSDHVNVKGARFFTKKLDSILKISL
jgi:hypothetical protein